jgi:hypothetical protein
VAELARAVRQHPVSGTVPVADGTLQTVTVDEVALIGIIRDGDLHNGAELAAVADALAAGDSAPLLRLAAETFGGGGGDSTPIDSFSAGDNAAAFCNDADFVWNRTDPVPVRRAKYREGLAELGPNAFAPFSPQAWNEYAIPDFCLRWPAPDRFTPAVPRGATISGVPTLILSGDIDTVVPTSITRTLLKVFRGATLLPVAGSDHPAAGRSDCARAAVQAFIRTPGSAVGNCAEPAFVVPAVPAYPQLAAAATPAAPNPGDGSNRLDRQVVTVAVRTVLDAWLRSFRIPEATGTGVGLRGGAFDFDYSTFDDHAVIQLHGARFANDVSVQGESTWTYASNAVHLQITVTGSPGHNGSLTADGLWGFAGPFRDFTVTGALGARTINVSTSAN